MRRPTAERRRFLAVYDKLNSVVGTEAGIDFVKRLGAALGMELISIIEHLNDNHPSTDSSGLPIAERGGWSHDFVTRWYERGYVRQHPFFQRCRFEALPFAASGDDLWAAHAPLTPSQLRMRKDMVEYGIRAMIIVPLHLPKGRLGAVVWATRSEAEVYSIVEAYRSELLAVGHIVMAQMKVSAIHRERDGDAATLTQRQLECIYWASNGKTIQETSSIIGISKYTVSEHLREAIRRLGAVNIAHATALAAQYGILGAIDAEMASNAAFAGTAPLVQGESRHQERPAS